MHRTTVYVPVLAPASPAVSNLLELVFERGDIFFSWKSAARDLQGTGLLPGLTHARTLLRSDTWRRRAELSLPRRAPFIYLGSRVPNIVRIGGTGLGIGLGLLMQGGCCPLTRVLAFGGLSGGANGIDIPPVEDPSALLGALMRLGSQPTPLLCLIPGGDFQETEGPHRAVLGGLRANNLVCVPVATLDAAVEACGQFARSGERRAM